ncbi:uncharacterized protein A1O5_00986 [Cladophialophora psammophila CBS 110553]|uniref:NAD(P)-binding protein n=1 Tax=Cladophialophora psammophila CBS 110553 TaxID=1182543 RepID=W9X8E3_9EURO|nr:uncharacterized protein A1O5_00986 [Cladophialophora psammophila CBS 110553]EXJ76478.1 hypothetical protein A1O5_00986 [Cladophialophora psammophila CBS 110553]
MTQRVHLNGATPHDLSIHGSFTKGIYRDAYPTIDPTRPELSQKGMVVMITGASKGIGRDALAPVFAVAGARAIIITARKATSLVDTVANLKSIDSSVEVLALDLDISRESSITAAFKTISEHFPGGVDILVSNAVSKTAADQWITTCDIEKCPIHFYASFHTTNTRGSLLLTKYFLTQPTTSKEKPLKRKIVYVSSGISYIVNPGQSADSFSKLIINQLAAYAHAESNEEIQVQAVAVHPGIFVTDILEDIYRFYAVDTNKLAGGVINWAASDEAEFMSGRYTTANVRLCVIPLILCYQNSSLRAYIVGCQRRLWNESKRSLTKIF